MLQAFASASVASTSAARCSPLRHTFVTLARGPEVWHVGRMRFFAYLVLFAVACGEPPPPRVVAPPAPSREETCLAAARACSKHAFDGHPEGLVDCMPDEIVERFGGRQALVDTLTKNAEPPPQNVDETQIEAPTQMVKGPKRTFAVVPQTIGLRAPEGHYVMKSYLLGVSPDDGRTWRFVDGVELDRPKAQSLFPDLPETITLPKVDPPQLLAK